MKSKPLPNKVGNVKILKDLGQRYCTENSKRKVRYCTIECVECGKEHDAIARHVLAGNIKRCTECGRKQGCKIKNQKARELFVSRAIKKHGFKYGYEKVKYTTKDEKVLIQCRRCGEDFYQRANDHIRGRGCKHCCKGKSDYNVFYLWKIKNTDIYKIGVTSKRLGSQRIDRVLSQYKKHYGEAMSELIIKEEVKDASMFESLVLKKFNDNPIDVIFDGCTEFRRLSNKEVRLIQILCALYRLNDNGEYERNLKKALYYIQSELDWLKENNGTTK